MKILSGDVGGTKTVLAIIEYTGTSLNILRKQNYLSYGVDSFDELISRFLSSSNDNYDYACFGVPGPIAGGRCITTNLPWLVDTDALLSRFGFSHTWLLNDLEAHAWGIECLQKDDLFILNVGKPETRGNRAIIAAGTGLGEAGLFWDKQQYRPFATEGGHSSFSPNSDLEIELLRFLRKKYGHVSWERTVSGMGLVDIYRFLLVYYRAIQPPWLTHELEYNDQAACISNAALAGKCEICMDSLNLFTHLYGVETGNLALKIMAQGGIYIGGGIAPKILEKLKQPIFFDSFKSKGRMSPLLEDIPIKVILNTNSALYGPTRFAATQLEALGVVRQ